MATTRISKIKVRSGQLSDLPVLDPSEFGYSTDEHRLFIGNTELTVGTGNGTNRIFNIPISSNFPLPTNNLENPKFFVNGSQRSDIVIGGTTVTFATAPVLNAIVTIKFNSEIALVNSTETPSSLVFNAATPLFLDTNFTFNYTIYDTCYIDYTIRLTNNTGFRMGRIRLMVDKNNAEFKIDDEYNSLTNTTEIDFDARLSGNYCYLTYKNNTVSPAVFKYTFKLWKM
jgi:hypothetical protein